MLKNARSLLLISLFGLQFSCASIKKNSHVSADSQTPRIYTDFCKLTDKSENPNMPALWSAQTVQHQISKLIADSSVNGTPWAAYPVSYLKMTAARDKARCGGVLTSKDPFVAQMNSMLSDVMTRWYVLSTQQCAKSNATLGQTHGFCALMKKSRAGNQDALSTAMGTTGIYISSHIALSLSAIILADDFWNESPLANTKRDSGPWADVLEARIDAMKLFKSNYDLFNGFLANNLDTVTRALIEAKLLKGNTAGFLVGLARFVPFKSFAFGKIRDDAFATGLDLARSLTEHPMIQNNKLNYGSFDFDFVFPENLAKLEAEAIQLAANPTNIQIYRHVLGGKSWEELVPNGSL